LGTAVGPEQDVGSCATSVGNDVAPGIVQTVQTVQDVQIEATDSEIL